MACSPTALAFQAEALQDQGGGTRAEGDVEPLADADETGQQQEPRADEGGEQGTEQGHRAGHREQDSFERPTR